MDHFLFPTICFEGRGRLADILEDPASWFCLLCTLPRDLPSLLVPLNDSLQGDASSLDLLLYLSHYCKYVLSSSNVAAP